MIGAKYKMIEFYIENFPEDAYAVLMKYSVEEIIQLVQIFPPEKISSLIKMLPVFILGEVVKELEINNAITILGLMDVNTVSRILRNWRDSGDVKKYEEALASLNQDLKGKILKLLGYSKDSIGFLMNPAPFVVSPTLTLKEVLFVLGKEKNRYSRYIYIVDSEKRLLGVLPFKEVFYAAESNELISKYMSKDVFSLLPTTKASSIYSDKIWSKWDSLPVIDHKNTLLGVVKYEVLEDYFLKHDIKTKDDSLDKAGEAIAEVIKVGVKGTISLTSDLLRSGRGHEKS